MAFDISLDSSPSTAEVGAQTFAEFFEANVDRLATALTLSCGDSATAEQALMFALATASRQWKRRGGDIHQASRVFEGAVARIDKRYRDQRSVVKNEATGGYVRGMSLNDAFDALPLRQRAGLVMAYYLCWSDDQAAGGVASRRSAVVTRRTRATAFLAHHLKVPQVDVESAVSDHLRVHASTVHIELPDAATLQRRGHGRAVRNRLGAVVLVAAVIVGGAGAVQVVRQDVVPQAAGPPQVEAPSNSADWFGPVPDGTGGFVALDVSGSSRFIESANGEDWFARATWNSRAVDLRTEVTSFSRSGGRYVATIEPVRGITGPVPLRVATSVTLDEWRIQVVDIAPLEQVEGLQARRKIANVAVSAGGEQIVVALEVKESVDYAVLGVSARDVCVDADFDDARVLQLCSGDVIEIERRQGGSTTRHYVLLEGSTVSSLDAVPEAADPTTLVSVASGFMVAESRTGRVWMSPDARTWVRSTEDRGDNKFVLLDADTDGRSVIVFPAVEGWQSVMTSAGVAANASIDLELDPTKVWSKPDIATGPAGTALFVTTSRPWDRSDASPGWAIDTGEWVVSRLPDAEFATARHPASGATVRFRESPWMRIARDGAVVLDVPQGSERGLVDSIALDSKTIEDSRAASVAGEPTAQVFFTVDGRSWSSIWRSQADAWFGSVAVGDDEVVISGTTLTGKPFAVPLN